MKKTLLLILPVILLAWCGTSSPTVMCTYNDDKVAEKAITDKYDKLMVSEIENVKNKYASLKKNDIERFYIDRCMWNALSWMRSNTWSVLPVEANISAPNVGLQ